MIAAPKFVALDTASISHAAANPGDNDVKRMLDAFSHRNWIPFLTDHHLEEIAGHQNDEVFEMRLDFLRRLPSIAYCHPGSFLLPDNALLSCHTSDVASLSLSTPIREISQPFAAPVIREE